MTNPINKTYVKKWGQIWGKKTEQFLVDRPNPELTDRIKRIWSATAGNLTDSASYNQWFDALLEFSNSCYAALPFLGQDSVAVYGTLPLGGKEQLWSQYLGLFTSLRTLSQLGDLKQLNCAGHSLSLLLSLDLPGFELYNRVKDEFVGEERIGLIHLGKHTVLAKEMDGQALIIDTSEPYRTERMDWDEFGDSHSHSEGKTLFENVPRSLDRYVS